MKRDHVLAIVAQHQAELKAMGVKSLALFGSVAGQTHLIYELQRWCLL